MYNVIHKHIGAIMNIKENGIDIDDAGIMSVFFEDEKIVSMSIDADNDGLISSKMLSTAPTKYANSLYALINNINKFVIIKHSCYITNDFDNSSYVHSMSLIRQYTDNYNGV